LENLYTKPISRPTLSNKLSQDLTLFFLVWTILVELPVSTEEEEILVDGHSPGYTRYSGLSSRRICDHHLVDGYNLISDILL
jgi:hypothetical protein